MPPFTAGHGYRLGVWCEVLMTLHLVGTQTHSFCPSAMCFDHLATTYTTLTHTPVGAHTPVRAHTCILIIEYANAHWLSGSNHIVYINEVEPTLTPILASAYMYVTSFMVLNKPMWSIFSRQQGVKETWVLAYQRQEYCDQSHPDVSGWHEHVLVAMSIV